MLGLNLMSLYIGYVLYMKNICIYIILSMWSQNVNSMLLLFFGWGLIYPNICTANKCTPKYVQPFFSSVSLRKWDFPSLFPKPSVFCQNIFMTYFSCVSITNSCHRQYEEFWCKHFTSEHFAFSSHLFAVRLVCKGLYWLTPSDLTGGWNDYHFFH